MDPQETLKNAFNDLSIRVKGAYESVEEQYYKMAEWLEAHHIPFARFFLEPFEKRGIPSFPIFALIVLLFFGTVMFVLLGPMLSQSSSVKITVLSEEGKVNGALVELTGTEFERSGETIDGEVEFAGLPKGEKVTIKVSKSGFREVEQFFVIGQRNSLSFNLESNIVGVTLLVTDFQERPLPQVELQFEYANNAGQLVSNSERANLEGKAVIHVIIGATVTVTASLEGYETKTISFTADEGLSKKIFMRQERNDGPNPPPSEPSDRATITINTKDDDGNALDAHVVIRDAETNALLAETDTRFGTATVTSLDVGTEVKIVAELDDYDRAVKTVTLKRSMTVSLTLLPLVGGERSLIKIQDEQGKSITAYIAIIEAGEGEGNFTVAKETTGKSELSAILAPARSYYAVAYKDGYLPGKTLRFFAGESKTILLAKATSLNSGNLTISTYDEDGQKITKSVSIAFFDTDNEWIPPFNVRITRGSDTIAGLPRSLLTVKGSYGSLKGNASADLSSGSDDINLTLLNPRGTIRVYAKDFDNNTITTFSAAVYLAGTGESALHASCEAANAESCDMLVRVDKRLNLTVNAPLYREWRKNIPAKTVPADNVSEQTAILIRLDDDSIVRIAFAGMSDASLDPVTQLIADQYYLAKFSVYFREGVSTRGVFVRLQTPDYEEVGHIVNHSHQEIPLNVSGSFVLRGDGNFSGNVSSSVCSIDYTGGAAYQLAWVNAEYDFTGPREVAYWIRVKPDVENMENLSVHYRAYASDSGVYYRTPEDEGLGNHYGIEGRPWCAANTLSENFAVLSCGQFGQACCSTRDAPDFACDAGYQCLSDICTFPTSCGSTSLYCTDNDVCCEDGGSKSCEPSDSCSDPAQCVPVCDPLQQFCDSSQPEGGGICRTEDCGEQGESCCGGNSCDESLICDNGECTACGLFDQVCCSWSESNPSDACSDTMQCIGNQCTSATFCGSQENACVGATVCCKDEEYLGQCTLHSVCNDPVICDPLCSEDQYCDASDLENPLCRACDAEHCPLGEPGGMCDPSEQNACPSGYICLQNPGSELGTCTPCGQDNQACCAGDSCSLGLECVNGQCGTCGGMDEACCPGNVCDAPLTCQDSQHGYVCTTPTVCGISQEICTPDVPLCCITDEQTGEGECVANEAACDGVLSSCEPPCTGITYCDATELPASCAPCADLLRENPDQIGDVCPGYCNVFGTLYCEPEGGQQFYCPHYPEGSICQECGQEGQDCCPIAQDQSERSICEGDNLFCTSDSICAERIACGNDVCSGEEECCLTQGGLTCTTDLNACILGPFECDPACQAANNQDFCQVFLGPPTEAACVHCSTLPMNHPMFQLFCADFYCDDSHRTCSTDEFCTTENVCAPLELECTESADCGTFGPNYYCNGANFCEECYQTEQCISPEYGYSPDYRCIQRDDQPPYVRGVCVDIPECSTNEQCREWMNNETFVCAEGVCAPEWYQCLVSTDCEENQLCDGWVCRDITCDDIEICDPGFHCDPDLVECVEDVGPPPTECGGFSEACCSGADPCDYWMQCIGGSCTYPTVCGDSSEACQDNEVCCESGGAKSCTPAAQCTGGFTVSECTPVCDLEDEYCDSTGVNGRCKDAEPICSALDQYCRQANACDQFLLCNQDAYCVDCGEFGQQCCDFGPACGAGYQCWGPSDPDGRICASPTFCGSSENECLGETVCCGSGSHAGECVLENACNDIRQCDPYCEINEYCDSVNLNNDPACKTCDGEHCELGGNNQLCDPNAPQPCDNTNFRCIVSDETIPLGICSACGYETGPCCGSDSCVSDDLVCDTLNASFGQDPFGGSVPDDNIGACEVGNTLCRFGNCITIYFSQYQQCTDPDQSQTGSCQLVPTNGRGGPGFEAHSMKNCDSERCDERQLRIRYVIEPYQLGDSQILTFDFDARPYPFLRFTHGLCGGGQSIDIGEDSIEIPLNNPDCLTGTLFATPWEPTTRVAFTARFYDPENPTRITEFPTHLAVMEGTPQRNPSPLENYLSCNELTLVAINGPRGPYIESSCEKIVFQVDSIFPADAIKADFSGLYKPGLCEGTSYIKFYKDGDLQKPVHTCFVMGTGMGGDAIRYHPTNDAGCAFNSHSMELLEGNVEMQVKCELNGEVLKTIDIEIVKGSTVESVPAIDISTIGYKDAYTGIIPHPYSYYDYNRESESPLRTVYVTDNRQLKGQGDIVKVGQYVPSGNKYLFEGPTAYRSDQGRTSLFTWNKDDESSFGAYLNPRSNVVAGDRTPKIKTVTVPYAEESLSRKIHQQAALDAYYGAGWQTDLERCLAGCDADFLECMDQPDAHRGTCSWQRNQCSLQCYVDHPDELPPNPEEDLDEVQYMKNVLDDFTDYAREVSRKTAFRRAYGYSIWCTKPADELVPADYFNTDICRSLVEDWQDLIVDTGTIEAPCTFCHDTYANTYGQNPTAAELDYCDIRCDDNNGIECDLVSTTDYCAMVDDTATPQFMLGVDCNIHEECIGNCPGDPDYDPNSPSQYEYTFECVAAHPPASGSFSFFREIPASGPDDEPPEFLPFDCQISEENGNCYIPCEGKDVLESNDYCGDVGLCSECRPDGYKTVELEPIYVFTWLNETALHEILVDAFEIDPQSPYKYFVNSPAAKPFEFSMAFQASGNELFNALQDLHDVDYSTNVNQLRNDNPRCTARLGVYNLQTRSQDGEVWQYSGQYKYHIDPLMLQTNYPRYWTDDGAPEGGSGDDDPCGAVKACNLFDPAAAGITPGGTWGTGALRNEFDNLQTNCFAFEWPIVPDYRGADHPIRKPKTDGDEFEHFKTVDVTSDWRKMGFLNIDDGMGNMQYNTNYWFMVHPASQNSNQFLSVYLSRLARWGKSGGSCGLAGKKTRSASFDIVLPYNIDNYPNVFSFVPWGESAWCHNGHNACGTNGCCTDQGYPSSYDRYDGFKQCK
ncbi:hypothetical protein KJ765_00360 [Candidatus Micrarchaeota archaeon]|nr:hypothetical protein [Candidatus Micrarchaeota archaeon]